MPRLNYWYSAPIAAYAWANLAFIEQLFVNYILRECNSAVERDRNGIISVVYRVLGELVCAIFGVSRKFRMTAKRSAQPLKCAEAVA